MLLAKVGDAPGTRPLPSATRPMLPVARSLPSVPYLAVAASALVLSMVALTGASVERTMRPVPWHLDVALQEAVGAATEGRGDVADDALDRARWWNPGAWSLGVVAAYVDHASGSISDAQLAASVTGPGPRGVPMAEQTLVARRLVEVGSPELAREVIDPLRPVVEAHRA